MAQAVYSSLVEGPNPNIEKIGIALELFHLFCLVQDDIIDQSYLRHGLKTLHRQIESKLRQSHHLTAQNAQHLAQGQAMLVGDMLCAWANQLMLELSVTGSTQARLNQIFQQNVLEFILGQMVDVDIVQRKNTSLEMVLLKNKYKTARYTFMNPMLLGLILAQSVSTQAKNQFEGWQDFCTNYGQALGLAFQIQDDYLDLTGSSSDLNKPVMQDIQNGQPTVFSQYIFKYGSAEHRQLLGQYFGNQPINPHQRELILGLMQDSGALSYGLDLMNGYFIKAENLASELKIEPTQKDIWRNLVNQIKNRSN